VERTIAACGSKRVERRPGERGQVADVVGILFGELRAADLVASSAAWPAIKTRR
jgi:hypothetical protein